MSSLICACCKGRGETQVTSKIKKCPECEGLGILVLEDSPQFFDSENKFNFKGNIAWNY